MIAERAEDLLTRGPPVEIWRRGFNELFIAEIAERGIPVRTGVFGAMMDVHIVNSGPVTLLIDSSRDF